MKLTVLATLAATPALAHAGPHLHPHGAEAAAAGLVLAALAWLLPRAAR
jgi:hypothetical protein